MTHKTKIVLSHRQWGILTGDMDVGPWGPHGFARPPYRADQLDILARRWTPDAKTNGLLQELLSRKNPHPVLVVDGARRKDGFVLLPYPTFTAITKAIGETHSFGTGKTKSIAWNDFFASAASPGEKTLLKTLWKPMAPDNVRDYITVTSPADPAKPIATAHYLEPFANAVEKVNGAATHRMTRRSVPCRPVHDGGHYSSLDNPHLVF